MSGISDYGNFGPQNPNAAAGTNASLPMSGAKSSPLSASSIQESELRALELSIVANIPILIQPTASGNTTSAVSSAQLAGVSEMSAEAKKNDIISKMWDSYLDSIRQIAERSKKEDLTRETVDAAKPGTKSATEYFTYLMALSATARADEIGANSLTTQFTATYNQWIVSPVDQGANTAVVGTSSGLYPASSFMAGCVASSPDAIRSAIGASSPLLDVQLSSSPVADALFAIGPTSGLPGDYQAAAALVAALLNGGAVYKATADTVITSGGAKPQYDLNFATNYAKNIMAIVTKGIGEEDPTDPQRNSQSNMVRLMLSVMALNMVYRAAYGGMQSKEFDQLLAGNTGDLPSEIKGVIEQLVGLVNAYLPKNPKTRSETIARLMDYVDSKDSVDSMLETSRIFTSSLTTGDVNANRLASGKS